MPNNKSGKPISRTVITTVSLALLLMAMTNPDHKDSPPTKETPKAVAVTPHKVEVPKIASRSGESIPVHADTPAPKPAPVTKPVPEPPHETYSGWMDFQATFYTLAEGSGTGLTKTGTVPTAGRTLAVDPNIIPLGCTVEISYPDGHVERRVAEDTGGAIHGRILDVYVVTVREALDRGRQNVKLRIVYPPK